MKNLLEIIKENKLSSAAARKDFFNGKQVHVLANHPSGGANVLKSDILFCDVSTLFSNVRTVNASSSVYGIDNRTTGSRSNSVKLIELGCNVEPVTIDSIKEQIKEKENDMISVKECINDLKLRIKFMKEQGLKEFDPKVYKTYKILNTLQNSEDIGSYGFAEVITKMINENE